MAKKQAQAPREAEKTAAEYYKLNFKAVDELVDANKSNSPEVSREELKKYGAKSRLTLSQWLKAIIIKVWFYGVVCYFFIWGLGAYALNSLDLWAITAVAMGFVNDLAVNNILRLVEKDDATAERWMMVTKRKRFVTLPLNVIYAFAIMALDILTYALINRLYPLGVGPILFGIISVFWDMAFIWLKRFMLGIVSDARKKVDSERNNKR